MEELKAFSIRHYDYINQLLGDLTLRAVIEEEFKSPGGWTLEVEPSGPGFEGSFHHYCTKGSTKWCSVDEGIQVLRIHPHDTLCQSYSMMQYMGNMEDTDKKLTKGLQERMVVMWRGILANRKVQEQIIFSISQAGTFVREDTAVSLEKWERKDLQALAKKHGVRANEKSSKIIANLKRKGVAKQGYLMQHVTPRSKGIIKKINTVLDEWAEYGWKWYQLTK